MLEVRVVGPTGKLRLTANEKITPISIMRPGIRPSKICLFTNVFHGGIRYVRWLRNLTENDVAVAYYGKDGCVEKLLVDGQHIGDFVERGLVMSHLVSNSPMTLFNVEKHKSYAFFYLQPRNREFLTRIRQWI